MPLAQSSNFKEAAWRISGKCRFVEELLFDNGESKIFPHNVMLTFELQDTMGCIMEYYETSLNGNIKIINTETYP